MEGVVGILIWLFLVVVFREVYCWYAKINERVKLMEIQIDQSRETNRLLAKLLQEGHKEKVKNMKNGYEVAAELELSGEQPEEY